MLRVLGHFVTEQAAGLIGLACLICLIAAGTAMRLLAARPAGSPRQGLLHLAGAVVAFSAGAWATHFVGLLAFRPDVPFGFNLTLCAASLVLIISVTAIAFAIRPGRRGTLRLLQGLLLAAGVAAMHVVGMRAMLLPGKLYHPANPLLVSMGLGFGLIMASMWILQRGPTAFAAVLLALGALSFDLLDMASVRLVPTPGLPIPPDVIPHPLLVTTTTGACLMILMMATGASLLDHRQARRLAAEVNRFRALADATFEGLMLARHGCVVDANQAMGDLMDRPPEALVG
jgi:NO-binding membrane sensor protein with MHYT domain